MLYELCYFIITQSLFIGFSNGDISNQTNVTEWIAKYSNDVINSTIKLNSSDPNSELKKINLIHNGRENINFDALGKIQEIIDNNDKTSTIPNVFTDLTDKFTNVVSDQTNKKTSVSDNSYESSTISTLKNHTISSMKQHNNSSIENLARSMLINVKSYSLTTVLLIVFITSLLLVLVGIFFIKFYKYGNEWWQHRHYQKMDFLIDGIYNN